jgi:hypothetical protein
MNKTNNSYYHKQDKPQFFTSISKSSTSMHSPHLSEIYLYWLRNRIEPLQSITMNKILLFTLTLAIMSCASQSEESVAYRTELRIESVFFYGDTITFDSPRLVTLNPQSNQITHIDLGNGTPFGVKQVFSELITDGSSEILHSINFYEGIDGEWKDLAVTDHRKPLVMHTEQESKIETSGDDGTYFIVKFSYQVNEI